LETVVCFVWSTVFKTLLTTKGRCWEEESLRLLLMLGLTPKVLEPRNERLEGFEDLGCEEEMIGEGKIGLVEAEDAIDGSSE
jgi:predicted metal-dependent TIM-barrel fold hydrolase